MKRFLVKLGLFVLNRPEKVNKGKAVSDAIKANPDIFPPDESTPFTDALDTKTGELSAADAATETGSHESFAAADAAELQWDIAMRTVGGYVQSKADANLSLSKEIILAAALEVHREKVKMSFPLPVDGLTVATTGLGTVLKIGIHSANARTTRYVLQMTTTPDNDSSWAEIANITSHRFKAEGLINGTRYYFRARAENTLGKSLFCSPVAQVAA